MKYWRIISTIFLVVVYGQEECLKGIDFLNGIKTIIGADPNVPSHEVELKPFVGSFSTIKTQEDKLFSNTTYCMTDNACGHWDAYSRQDVPLSDLNCNSFCFIPISTTTGLRFMTSTTYSPENPPSSYLNCGWETCG